MPPSGDKTEWNDSWDVDPDDDRDDPQADDISDDDDDLTPTVPCPNCRREIPDFADRCPYCGDWVVQSAGVPRRAKWWVIVVVIALTAFVLVYVLR